MGFSGSGTPRKSNITASHSPTLSSRRHAPGDLVARGLRWVLFGDPEVATNERKNGEPRHRLPMGYTVSLVDLDLPRSTALHKLVAKAAFAGSRLGDYADDLRVPRYPPLECRLQSRHLALTSDELGEAARSGDLESGPHPAHTLELEDAQWVA